MNAVVISELTALDDLRELADLFAGVWQRSGEPPIGSDVLRALAHSGNYVSGARQDGRLVGGLVGWLGGRPPDHVHMHSHILGVVPDRDTRGLGFALKQHQRRWCLERGIRVMEWTTDPLIRRNAYFNLTKLGAQAHSYLINFYGQMADGLNAGEESDRLLIVWELDSPAAERAASGDSPQPDVESLIDGGAAVRLRIGSSGEPVRAPGSDGRVLLCQVPEDIVAVRRSRPDQARSWRLALREAMTTALDVGFAVSGATRSGWYVLERPEESRGH
ncbi:MAG TPA: GNAT family N-acetyltransferase [Patescibacteria group bacterium]|nr:GNAT family N-acetyltransferase [Patescibacteria group bacterium]